MFPHHVCFVLSSRWLLTCKSLKIRDMGFPSFSYVKPQIYIHNFDIGVILKILSDQGRTGTEWWELECTFRRPSARRDVGWNGRCDVERAGVWALRATATPPPLWEHCSISHTGMAEPVGTGWVSALVKFSSRYRERPSSKHTCAHLCGRLTLALGFC